MINVVWLSLHSPRIIARGYWDEGMLEDLFAGRLGITGHSFRHLEVHEREGWVPEGEGAIVVIPARHHAEDVETISAALNAMPWCVVMFVGDEAGEFPWREIVHPNMRRWLMTPPVGSVGKGDAYLIGDGYPPGTVMGLAALRDEADRSLDFFFSGQVTHELRAQCTDCLKQLPNGQCVETPGFTQGLTKTEYLRGLASAKVAPSPGGPETPDTFRLFEGLEAGCIPVADSRASGYWQMLFGEDPPFPVLDDWDHFPAHLVEAVQGWPNNVVRIQAWWQWQKLDMVRQLQDDLTGVGAPAPDGDVESQLTVLVATSPIPAHPDPSITLQTIRSIRAQLPNAQIIVMADGVRPEQEHRSADYQEYLRRLFLYASEYRFVTIVFPEHRHQAAMTKFAVETIRTPLLMFVEHDTPLTDGYIPWGGIASAVQSGEADLVRLHHEVTILEPHKHLMLDEEPRDVFGVPLMRTVQWSQRPHVASTAFYKKILVSHFSEESRTMIEDQMHGVVQHAHAEEGMMGWYQYRLWIYTPEGNIQRSLHTDGRCDDPKFEMVF